LRKKNEPYTNKQTIFVNIEGNVKEALEDICYKERMTLTAKVQELIDQEVRKKAEGITTPIAIAYNDNSRRSNMRQTSLSVFANLSKNVIEEETNLIEDQSILTRLKTNYYTGSKAVDKKSMVLYAKGIKQ
jgi:hypothetical protein